jgi:hypothetical protein
MGRIWFDTEFHEDGKTIDLISIGLVREDGAVLYMESNEFDVLRAKANPWLAEHVLPKLGPSEQRVSRDFMRQRVLEFVGDKPEFWAWYADYDWVVLCQLFGRMIDLPKGWPMYCHDFKQVCDAEGLRPEKQKDGHHNALSDAMWLRHAMATYGYA